MTHLLDTHALVWAVIEPERLSEPARAAMLDPAHQVFASHVSLWEMSIKRQLGKLPQLDRPALRWFEHFVPVSGFTPLRIEAAALGRVEDLPEHHRDPFDRLLVAQALIDGLTIISADRRLSPYDVRIAW